MADDRIETSALDGGQTKDHDPFATLPPPDGNQPIPGPRFRILRRHARGNLGEVFVAHDEELCREVALKEIQDRHADRPESRSRFLLEAEVTGRLEHPGIVPVYSLGHYADGRPYYAMRFIQGISLKEAIDQFHKAEVPGRDPGERTLALRKLLDHFIDVCDAMNYAHSRGILHRDLKPANIMLGKHGETLVVDWGLAKAGDRPESLVPLEEQTIRPSLAKDSQNTIQGARIGTPAFMSPEQAAGQLDRLGPASDVYSLGATFYSLLTGKVAFSGGNVEILLQMVQQGDFPPPRAIRPDTPRVLEAICLKAMALKPEDRYATPRTLADDIEQWMADEPVSAYREPWWARAFRWGRRHKPAVAGAAALLITTTVSLAIGIAWIGHERSKAVAERHRADEKTLLANRERSKAVAERQRADLERSKAVLERQRADEKAKLASERFGLALDAFGELVFNVQDRLEDSPATHAIRENLLITAVTGFERLVKNAENATDVNHGMVVAHLRLGDISLLVGETKKAREQYELGFQIASKLAEAVPHDTLARYDLSLSYIKLGDVSLEMGDAKAAQVLFKKALDICVSLANSNPGNIQAQRDLSTVYGRLGKVSLQLGDAKSALGYCQNALKLNEESAKANPKNAEIQRSLALSYSNLGDITLQLGDDTAACGYYLKDLELSATLAEAHPDSVQAQRHLSASYEKLGDANLRLRDPKTARDYHVKSLSLREGLAKADPDDVQSQRDLLASYDKLAAVSLQLGDSQAAKGYNQKSLDLRAELAKADPDNALARREQFVTNIRLGEDNLERGDLQAARDYFQKARALGEALTKANPDNKQFQRDLAVSYIKLGDISLRGGGARAARDLYQKALTLSQALAEANPDDAEARRDLSVTYNKLGDVALELGDAKAAKDLYQKSLDLREAFAKANPDDAQAQRDLSVSLMKLGNTSFQLGNVQAARDQYQRSLTLREALTKANPDNLQAQSDLPGPHEKLGDVSLQLGDVSAARDHYKKSLDLRESLAKADPDNFEAQTDLVASCYKLGKLEQKTAPKESLDWFERGLMILRRLKSEGKLEGQPTYVTWIRVIEQEVTACRNALK
jgi:tetratricopeptide (TPR) repeat protein/tRNA A-37 threonylcarbamoyl transferase component Bud32